MKKGMENIKIIGGGLAGSEAAWQLAQRGIGVTLYEMRPVTTTPAHTSNLLGELVCSNSLGSDLDTNASGILKEELRNMDSLIMKAADHSRVPAGRALAVDRERFAQYITNSIESHPMIQVVREEMTSIPKEGIVIIASGPLTSDKLSRELKAITGQEYLHFYDATSPIVVRETIDASRGFWGSRYDESGDDYFNAPMNREEYNTFRQALITAQVNTPRDWEELTFFQDCMPIEEIARRGQDTLRFGPLKPVGLIHPETKKRPWAVVQLRKEDSQGNLLGLVGFQTSLKWGEQDRIFRMIPSLESAEFVRFGTIHRNTYINSPHLLEKTLQLKEKPGIFFAGQITGVDGYIESTAMGMAAGINASKLKRGAPPVIFPAETVMGSLIRYITSAETKNFQPMNSNFGLMVPLQEHIKDKKARRQAMAQRALKTIEELMDTLK